MIKKFLTNLRIDNVHPAEEKLLGYVDDELSARQAARLRAHLGTCWSCRARLDKIEETISLFVEFRSQIQSPLTSRPPGNWSGFGGNMAAAAAAPFEQVGWSLAEIFRLWRSYFAAINPSNWSSAVIRAFSGSVAAFVIIALLWQLIAVRTVSAVELLDRAMAGEGEKIRSVSQPVVYSKIRVQRQNAESFEWEVWSDAARGRYRQTLSGGPQSSPPARGGVAAASDDGVVGADGMVLSGLGSILRANRMNPLSPLSPESFRAWHDPLTDKTDEVLETQNAGGEKLLTLRTDDNAAQNPGQIAQAVLKVRKTDWHPIALVLRVKGRDADETYTFTELEFQVVSLSTLKPDFFGEDITPQVAIAGSPNPSPSSIDSPSPEAKAAASSNTSVVTPTAAATDEDEVEVLRLLSQAKADLGEQITVKRENGLLFVRGIVETPQRKTEILGALQPEANNPAVRIEIETYAEATARQTKQQSNSAVKQEVVGADSQMAAAENELVERLGTTAAARVFSTQMVERSYRTMNHAYALRRLSRQFTTEQLRQMKPDARAKWLALVSGHAGAFRTETEALRGHLQKVFGAQGGAASAVPAVGDWSDVQRAIERLVETGSANDQVIRSAFAVSSGGPSFSAIKSAQFWQSLRTAEALAAKLAVAGRQ